MTDLYTVYQEIKQLTRGTEFHRLVRPLTATTAHQEEIHREHYKQIYNRFYVNYAHLPEFAFHVYDDDGHRETIVVFPRQACARVARVLGF